MPQDRRDDLHLLLVAEEVEGLGASGTRGADRDRPDAMAMGRARLLPTCVLLIFVIVAWLLL